MPRHDNDLPGFGDCSPPDPDTTHADLRERLVNDYDRMRALVWSYFEKNPANAYAAATAHVMAHVDLDDDEPLARALSEMVDEAVEAEIESMKDDAAQAQYDRMIEDREDGF